MVIRRSPRSTEIGDTLVKGSASRLNGVAARPHLLSEADHTLTAKFGGEDQEPAIALVSQQNERVALPLARPFQLAGPAKQELRTNKLCLKCEQP